MNSYLSIGRLNLISMSTKFVWCFSFLILLLLMVKKRESVQVQTFLPSVFNEEELCQFYKSNTNISWSTNVTRSEQQRLCARMMMMLSNTEYAIHDHDDEELDNVTATTFDTRVYYLSVNCDVETRVNVLSCSDSKSTPSSNTKNEILHLVISPDSPTCVYQVKRFNGYCYLNKIYCDENGNHMFKFNDQPND